MKIYKIDDQIVFSDKTLSVGTEPTALSIRLRLYAYSQTAFIHLFVG